MIIDRLYNEVERKGNVCVGLDTSLDYIPEKMKKKYKDIDEIIFQFNKKIIDCTEDITAIYKLQIAYYESYGIRGLFGYMKTLEYLRSINALSIGDVKRGDIASTADMYAKAHFEGDFETDFITLNPYMGFDSITPYLKYLDNGNKGVFVLLRTSNPGAKDIEYLDVAGKSLYYHVGDKLEEMGSKYIGKSGYSLIGAVVGGTHIDEAIEIRKRYRDMYFLIPGYGAQGAKGKDVSLYLKERNGGVVNSSRGIITAYKKHEDGLLNLEKYTREAVLSMREDIGYEG
ncbi:orotidine-5'-phosphate decarboxylase [Tissierella praeacuta DSM 18095]|uniref:Orotidine 5'-phosphate decarboxylase n=1 Tax=Tissierella praeacuta DSM 18095 TaxID=1123404 RepID=A0A1M4V8Q2_9FIRM|nr:orotidine-5'-phosphate decarboxylase [Tissierella praeacuta]SHE65371.1 orotidine-5'-phosphate decarboxylase [Tissierella praeacuta DSM 18095]SUP03040.1 orotidine 5'-phosphate decarboxylase [Tissierella praeacuta]